MKRIICVGLIGFCSSVWAQGMSSTGAATSSGLNIPSPMTSSNVSLAPPPSNQALQQMQQMQQWQQSQMPVAPIQGSSTTSNSGSGASTSDPLLSIASPVVASQSVSSSNSTGSSQNAAPMPVATKSVGDSAFDSVTSRLFPLTPAQVVQLHQMYNTSVLAQTTTPGTPPRPTATSQFVNLAPGSTPPVVRLAQGFVSSLVFLDSTGAPWPIDAYDVGDPKSFNIVWDRAGNTLMIQATQLYTYGNLAVRLKGLNTPVMLTLIPGQKAVDYRVDMRVQGYGPNANMPTMGAGLPPSADSVLLHVLDAVPPPGSKLLEVIGGEASAWLVGEKLYVRTRLTILSPGWIAFMSSGDGMNAYEMQKAPVLLVSWHGKIMQLKLEGL